MSRSRRRNIDKKNGKLTDGGSRDGHEKHCRGHWCWCGGKDRKKGDEAVSLDEVLEENYD